jgi:hypothetical protein
MIMLKEKILLSAFILVTILPSCAQVEENTSPDAVVAEKLEKGKKNKYKESHAYGGWYCPDNFGGFPPVDFKDFDKVPVVSDRLPTLEETRNGRALLYFDPEKHPDARFYDLNLPRMARYNSRQSGKAELIIVIQAAIIAGDTVVGFRFPSGGNGSAWLGELQFLSDDKIANMEQGQFSFTDTKVAATKEEVWLSLSQSTYGKKLADKFQAQAFFNTDWSDDSYIELSYDSDTEHAQGMIANQYGSLYLQIDYTINGKDFTEKLLVMPTDNGSSQIQVSAGPYGDDYEAEASRWGTLVEQLETSSEEQ